MYVFSSRRKLTTDYFMHLRYEPNSIYDKSKFLFICINEIEFKLKTLLARVY